MSIPGLSLAEAERRLLETGPNQVPARPRVSRWSSIARQFRDPLIVVLLAACALTVVTGDYAATVVIALVVAVNTAVGVSQELRADRAITALSALTTPSVRVRRGGHDLSVPSADLVQGDVVLLSQGDVVPADGELQGASSLLVDESSLTGESVAVGRSGPRDGRAGQQLMSGTVVVKGRATLLVSATGAASTVGRIAGLMDVQPEPTPLQRRLTELGRILAIVAVALCGVVLVSGLLRGEPLERMLVTALSLAVAAVPESLPAVVSVSLAGGARRMARRHAVVRQLAAVETLGSVSVLATDKTGTLTQGRMVVREIWTPGHRVTTSLDTSGRSELACDGAPLSDVRAPEVLELLRAAALCNDAQLVHSETGAAEEGVGDPTETALLAAAAVVGLDRSALETEYPRVEEAPFDSLDRRMTTVHDVCGSPGSDRLVITKGAPESLARLIGERAAAEGWPTALAHASTLADEGYRVLALTAGTVASGEDWRTAHQTLLGLVAMEDPAKPAARSTIEACIGAGVVPVLLTGDHPRTASAMAQGVGILTAEAAARPGCVVTGDQVAAGAVPDLTVPRVFARITPEQKLAIIQAWRHRGAVVAMTGDGVNDGPALRRADIGVAMGHRGTEVARQAADLVLTDDELGTVVAAIEEGRRVYANIRGFLVFGLAGGMAEILLMLLGPLAGMTLPLLAAQILWINLLTHGLTGVALGSEPAQPASMARPPRPPEQSVLGGGLWQRVLVVGVVLTATALALGIWADRTGRPWQTMLFLALTCLQLGVALGLRPRLLSRDNSFLPLAVGASVGLVLAGVYLPWLRDLLDTVPLAGVDAALAVGTGLVGYLAAKIRVYG